MGFLNGPISDRLRKLFKPDDPAWSPPRDSKLEVPKSVKRKSSGYSTGAGPDRAKVNKKGKK